MWLVKHFTGCLVANMRLGARAAYNHCLANVATSPGEYYFTDVAGPIRPLGIGGAKYILVAIDAFTRFLHVMPMRRKAQAASLLAQLFECVRVQVIRKQNNGVRRLRQRLLNPFVLGAESYTHFHDCRHCCTLIKWCSRT